MHIPEEADLQTICDYERVYYRKALKHTVGERPFRRHLEIIGNISDATLLRSKRLTRELG